MLSWDTTRLARGVRNVDAPSRACDAGNVPPDAHISRPPARDARELVRIWAIAVAGLAVAKLLSLVDPTGLLAANLAGVAAFLFIALPDARLRARGESWESYGLPWHGVRDPRTWRVWGRGAGVALLACAVVFPLFAAGFAVYAELLVRLPSAVARGLAPYAGAPRFAFRLPDRFLLLALVQLLVVALPEELFYRGFVQTSWARTAPERGVTVLGARLGAGFLWTQALFAARSPRRAPAVAARHLLPGPPLRLAAGADRRPPRADRLPRPLEPLHRHAGGELL